MKLDLIQTLVVEMAQKQALTFLGVILGAMQTMEVTFRAFKVKTLILVTTLPTLI